MPAGIDQRDPLNSTGDTMRRFLYSKWFFFILAVVCAVDLFADVGEQIWGRGFLNIVAIGLDCFAVFLSGWIFVDLHARRPRNGNDTRGR
jgi:hypothetical protein